MKVTGKHREQLYPYQRVLEISILDEESIDFAVVSDPKHQVALLCKWLHLASRYNSTTM